MPMTRAQVEAATDENDYRTFYWHFPYMRQQYIKSGWFMFDYMDPNNVFLCPIFRSTAAARVITLDELDGIY